MRLFCVATLTLSAIAAIAAVRATTEAAQTPGPNGRRAPLALTYVANSGALAATGRTGVLIDALFDRPNPAYRAPSLETIEKMVNGVAPFGNVRVVLVTHNHSDHFDGKVALRLLLKRPDVEMVAPVDAVAQMRGLAAADWDQVSHRVVAIDLPVGGRTTRQVRGVIVTAFRTLHGSSDTLANLMYLVEMHGWRLFHEGDSPADANEYIRLGLGAVRVDVALVHHWFATDSTCSRFLRQNLRPGHIALTHLPIAREAEAPAKIDAVRKSYTDIFLLAPGMRTRTFR